MAKNIAILGSTGSIGLKALQIVRDFPSEFNVIGLCAGSDFNTLSTQIREFKPDVAALYDDKAAACLRDKLADWSGTSVTSGISGLSEVAVQPGCDLVIIGIMGAVALESTLAAMRAGINVATANKEILVLGGNLINQEARKHNVSLLPIDSEQNAIFQCLEGHSRDDLERILLTASGGTFRDRDPAELADVTVEEALNHPTWDMGPKITIDSATMMNKGLEVIEAMHLFEVELDKIDVVIHPQSVVHSMVEFIDGSVLAQLGITDMYFPIAHTMFYPKRSKNKMPRLDFSGGMSLDFCEPEPDKYPCLKLAFNAARTGGSAPAVLNAANEVAVDAFLNYKISYNEIPSLISDTLNAHQTLANPSLEELLTADRWAREHVQELTNG
jgi:1-deoxy-D-xylulose-5-phosphate reductoisomerase